MRTSYAAVTVGQTRMYARNVHGQVHHDFLHPSLASQFLLPHLRHLRFRERKDRLPCHARYVQDARRQHPLAVECRRHPAGGCRTDAVLPDNEAGLVYRHMPHLYFFANAAGKARIRVFESVGLI